MSFAVGDVLNVGCSRVIITEVISPVEYTVTIVEDLNAFIIPDDPNNKVRLIEASEWNWVTPTDTIPGYGHLAGKELWGLADGQVVGPLFTNGLEGPDLNSVTLPFAAANVVLGLRYTSQIQTLYLTTEGIQDGSDQGKRKQISGVTVRTDFTCGLSAGTDFAYLTPIPELNQNLPNNTPYTGDARVLTFPQWDRPGQTCIQQTNPLPATVLGVIVEVTPGDTAS